MASATPVGCQFDTLSQSSILNVGLDGRGGRQRRIDWKHLLAYITGSVDQELLRRNEYLVTEATAFICGGQSIKMAQCSVSWCSVGGIRKRRESSSASH